MTGELTSADLRGAFARDELGIALQPLVDLRSGAVSRLEALARWQHPLRGQIAPATFVPLAERCGEATTLAFLVLERVVPRLPGWTAGLPDLRVAINVCVQTMQDPAFPDALARSLERHRLPGERLELEITESTFMHDPDRALAAVAAVRRLGCSVAIDDFGTGYSSLGYLATLPVNAVKIDRQFVSPMTADRRREAIVRATIALGHDLGFEVVAEGVEDRDTLELLGALGCDLAQGFHLARPLAADTVAGWLARWDPEAVALHPAPAPERPAARAPSGARRVLVADDEPAIVELIRQVLEEHGFRVLTAANGAEALRLVDEETPHVVLLDLNMPVLDGAGFVRAVRERGLRVPIVLMTAGSGAKRWAAHLGADAYLAKPFELVSLVDLADRMSGAARSEG